MKYSETQLLRSEIGTLEQIVSELTDDAVIVRLSLEQRLAVLRESLAELRAQPESHPLSITFRGAPVDGMRSIDAKFASKAVRAFVEATETVTASFLNEDLKSRGPLPAGEVRALRIVDTAIGSFGFDLELSAPQVDEQEALPFPERDVHIEAIATTLKLLDEAASDDEDAISDLIAEIHPRAATKVRAFASILAENNALTAVSFHGKELRLDTEDQVKRIVESLQESEISEALEEHEGTLLGVLPESRRFEVRLADGRLLYGKVGRSISDILALKSEWEGQKARLKFRVVHVRTRTTYVLTQLERTSQESLGK